MFCPQCGAPNEDEAIFCGNCGAVLNPEEMSVEAETENPAEVPAEEPEEETMIVEDRSLDEWAVEPPSPAEAPARSYFTTAEPATSGLAIASLVMGIGGLTILPLLGSILALIFGYMARNEIRQRPDELTGDGLAIAGIVMGWIMVGLSVLGILAGVGLTVCGICGAFGASSY